MAGGSKSNKVREWMRRRMAPRRKPATATTTAGSAGDINISNGSRSSESASAQSSPRRKLLATALVPSSALLMRWRNVVVALFQRAKYHLLWLVESVVVVAQLCFFFVRFGFRL